MYKYIPEPATVTLPANEYYQLIRRMERMDEERETYLKEVCTSFSADGTCSTNIVTPDRHPYIKDIADQLACTASSTPQFMDYLYFNKAHMLDPSATYFCSYEYTGCVNLLKYAMFADAWERAAQRALDQETWDETAEPENTMTEPREETADE